MKRQVLSLLPISLQQLLPVYCGLQQLLPVYCGLRSPATRLSLTHSSCLSLSMLVHAVSFLLLLDTKFSLLKQGVLPSSSASLLLLPCSHAHSKCPHTQLSFGEIFAQLPLLNKDKDTCLLFGTLAASQLLVTYTLCADEGDAPSVFHCISRVTSPRIPPSPWLQLSLFPSTDLVTTHLEDWVHHM